MAEKILAEWPGAAALGKVFVAGRVKCPVWKVKITVTYTGLAHFIAALPDPLTSRPARGQLGSSRDLEGCPRGWSCT